jgi:hypothetical protein
MWIVWTLLACTVEAETPGPDTDLDTAEQTQEIRAAIDAANYCDVPEDCANAGGACPFGCDILVNQSEVAGIQVLLADYQQPCDYDCAQLLSVECTGGECVGVYP